MERTKERCSRGSNELKRGKAKVRSAKGILLYSYVFVELLVLSAAMKSQGTVPHPPNTESSGNKEGDPNEHIQGREPKPLRGTQNAFSP